MPYKDPEKRREYARSYYSSEEQKLKKKEYDKKRYTTTVDRYKDTRSRSTYPHRYEYNGDWMCARCGSAENLVIHHVDFNHSNNNLNNLQCLCVSCHSKLHIETRARNARGQMIKEEINNA